MGGISVTVSAPGTVKPGSKVVITFNVRNTTGSGKRVKVQANLFGQSKTNIAYVPYTYAMIPISLEFTAPSKDGTYSGSYHVYVEEVGGAPIE